MKVDLEDLALVVTGAASGVGRAIAEEAVSAGVSELLLTDIDEAGLGKTAKALGSAARIELLAADLADPQSAAQICKTAKACFGRIDGLVNAAGITTRSGFVDGTAEVWDKLFAINARAPYLLMQGAISDMLARGGGGVIVNIQSVNAHCGTPELAIYSATKGALQTLTKNAANAHLGDRIRVNGINLGWTLTEAEHKMQTEKLGEPADWATRNGDALPLGRLVLPDEAARLAVYLLSPASAPMTGVSLDLEQTVIGAVR